MAKVWIKGKSPIYGQIVQTDAKYVVLVTETETVAIPRRSVAAVETI